MATAVEQLEAMRRLEENRDGYGAAPPRADVIDLARAFVGLIEAAMRQGPAPNAGSVAVSPTRTGGVLLEWESGPTGHEVEINPDGSIGFLHFDKNTQHMQTRKFTPGAPTQISSGLLNELQRLLAA